MSDLVRCLCEGEHPVEVTLRPEKTVEALKECLDRGFVHIRFTDTQGGTELGVRLDDGSSDLAGADLDRGTGKIKVAGNLVLDYVKVRCIAEIGLPELTGTGRLEVRPD